MDDLIEKVGQIFEKTKKAGDWWEDRPFNFYHTNLPFASFVHCEDWHEQGTRIGEC